MLEAKLGIGPISSEVIESVFRYSNNNEKELMLIASKNQIDYNKGYVNNWNTKDFMDHINIMRDAYQKSRVIICRDHCGPGFNGNLDLEDIYKTISSDIENGFDLIHIDLCHLSKEKILEESKKAIEYCLKLNPQILLEIGTDENTGENFRNGELNRIEKEINYFKNFCNPEFYVIQTGSLVKEISQVGRFNKNFVKSASELLKSKNIKFKEHNADYLSTEEIKKRNGLVDALNIAPQLGVIQTQVLLNNCSIYGINPDDFIDEAYKSKKWEKWLYKNSSSNRFLCSLIAGHYNFSSDNYKKLIWQLEKHIDINDIICSKITEVIKYYDNGISENNK